MSAFEVEQPILNSPFEEPAEHWQIEEGQRAEAAHRAAARPATSTATRRRRRPSRVSRRAATWQELELVNLIRERLAQWREAGYPGATRTTLELLALLAARRARSSRSSSRSSRRPRRSSS